MKSSWKCYKLSSTRFQFYIYRWIRNKILENKKNRSNRLFRFGFVLFGIGLIGILSILTMEIPLPPEAEIALKDFSPTQIKLIILINPILMLCIAIAIGTILYQRVNLSVPIVEKWVGVREDNINYSHILKYGILGGVLSGVLISIISLLFNPILPAEFIELGKSLKPSLAARFLYGGLTEEILMRFGFMTLMVWVASKIFGGTKSIVYWVGIIIASVIFALGHFPIAYQAVGEPSIGLLVYIIIGNTIAGLVFGWLYWKKGLESAFLAHIFAHIIMVIAESMMG